MKLIVTCLAVVMCAGLAVVLFAPSAPPPPAPVVVKPEPLHVEPFVIEEVVEVELPQKPVVVSKPKPLPKAAPKGHWVTQRYGRFGRRTQQVWVPHK